jgi:3-deoxy-manno-octulosonate cytidylyltransferase (CMP-KDO synthetase)
VRPISNPRPSQDPRGPGDDLVPALPSSPDSPRQTPQGPQIVAAIPARYGSTRLPGKPLLQLAGRPMIEHVYRRVADARGLARIVVLTDDERIAGVVAAFGGEVELTPAGCASGTDRIAHAARRWPDAAAVVNVQGDEPLIDPDAVSAIAAHLAAHPEDPMVTLAAPFASPSTRATGALGAIGAATAAGAALSAGIAADLANPNVVKVVVALDGRALYFSRSAIPYARQAAEGAAPLRHLGIYGYQRAALLTLADLPPSPLERSEALEQLRALEHGMSIRVLLAAPGLPGVDTREDLERAERLLELEAGRRQAVGTERT